MKSFKSISDENLKNDLIKNIMHKDFQNDNDESIEISENIMNFQNNKENDS